MNKFSQTQSNDRHRINAAVARCFRGSKFAAAILILAACVLGAIPLSAQNVSFIGPKLRAAVPVGYVGLTVLSNSMSYNTNGMVPDGNGEMVITPISVNLTGLPAGVTYTLTNMTVPATPVEFAPTAQRTNSNSAERLWVVLTFDGTTAEGTYTFSVNASGGAVNNLLYTLDVAHIWNGSTNAVQDGAGYWSVPAQWAANSTAGTNTDSVVIFNDWGGQTNSLTGHGTATTNYLFNSIVDDNYTVSSIRFAQTNNTGYRYHTIKIADGKTLTVTGNNGFSVLRDYVNEVAALATGLTVTFVGTNNAALVVTNIDANFSVLLDGQQTHQLDLSQLDNFRATVSRIALGDALAYPNFWNMDANNYGNHGNTSVPRRMLPTVTLARTNVIKATFVGPNDYTNAATRDYAICFSRGAYGSTTTAGPPLWILGLSNIFYADSICFNAYGSGNANNYCRFNSNFNFTNNSVNVTNNPIAIFRGTNGGRMTMFAIADAAGPGGEQSSTKGVVDLGMNRGVVDALVDRVIIAADRPIMAGDGSAQPNHQGTFGFGAGIFDANTVILGYQTSGVHTNTSTNFRGYCQGTLNVTNAAGVFKINDTLILGYTTETPAASEVMAGTINNRGQVNVNRGGTMMVNRVTVGGITKGSGDNTISITSVGTNISTFILSNTIAGPDKHLNTLTLSGGAVLQMHVDGSYSAPYIYTTNLTVGAGNLIRIGSLANVSYAGGVAQFPLILRSVTGSPTIPGVIMPTGFTGSGSIIPSATNALQWDLYVSTNPPNTNLVWRGPGATGTADWDTSSKYWLDPTTGLMTNFHNGDWVRFDDTPGYATNVNQASSILLPGQVAMSNAVLNYKFTGSGVQGGGVLTKQGTGPLEIGGTFAIPMTITEGLLTNNSSGIIVGVSVSTGASLGNAGTINGNVSCGGPGYNIGTIYGALTVASGGVVTNLASILNGVFTVQTNAVLHNAVGATIDNFGNSTVATNATLINEGFLGDSLNGYVQTITVNGTLKDSGGSVGLSTMSVQTLTIASGALFIPGGDSIGNSIIRNPQGLNMGPTAFPGRVTLAIGSTNIIKVDPVTPSFALLGSGALDFGPSQSSQQQNGCTLIITNVTGTPYTAGQYFKMFVRWDSGGNPIPTGTSTNCYPIIIPATPGPGLVWDLSRLWAGSDFGYIGVAAPPVVQLTNSFSFLGATSIVAEFAWPSTNQGWRLQTLVTPNTVGLNPDTNFNWTSVSGSWTNISATLTNRLSGGTNVFFRLVFP